MYICAATYVCASGDPLIFFFPSANTVLPCPQGSPEDGGKPFQCPVCGLVIKRKSYWKRHMVIHTGLKSHQCPLCPFRCARKDNLKSHMKVRPCRFSLRQASAPIRARRATAANRASRCHTKSPLGNFQIALLPTAPQNWREGSLKKKTKKLLLRKY